MATLQELENALVNADKAGDTEAAQTLAQAILQARQTQSRAQMSHPSVSMKPKDMYAAQAGRQSFLENAAAGAGGALYGMGYLGPKSLVGMDKPGEVADWKASMAGLGTTGGGTVGQIAGYGAPAALAAPFVGASVPGAMAVGAVEGLAMPAESLGERAWNTVASGGGAGLGQAGGNAMASRMTARATNKATEMAEKRSRNAVRDATLAVAQQRGMVVPPSYAGTGMWPRFFEGISGKYKTNQLARIKNQPRVNALIAEDFGLPSNTAWDSDFVDSMIRKRGGAYEALRSLDTPSVDDLFPAPKVSIKNMDDFGIDYNKDPIDVAVRKLGGINIDDGAGELRWLRESDLGKPNPRYGPFASRKGMSMDDMANALYQRGYLDERDMGQMLEKLERAAGGESMYSINMDTDVLLSGLDDALLDAPKMPALTGKTVITDKQFLGEINAISSKYKGAGNSFPGLKADDVENLLDPLKVGDFNISDALDAIKVLREKANAAYGSGNTGLGAAAKKASNALENMIDRHLVQTGAPENLLKDYRAARMDIAKLKDVKKALEGGNIDAVKLGAMRKSGRPFTGNMRDIAKFGQEFRDVAKPPASGDANPFTILDLWSSLGSGGIGALTSTPLGLAMALAPPTARVASRYSLLSGPIQRSIVQPKYSIGLANKVLPGLLDNPLSKALYPGAGIYGYGVQPSFE